MKIVMIVLLTLSLFRLDLNQEDERGKVIARYDLFWFLRLIALVLFCIYFA